MVITKLFGWWIQCQVVMLPVDLTPIPTNCERREVLDACSCEWYIGCTGIIRNILSLTIGTLRYPDVEAVDKYNVRQLQHLNL